MAAVANPHMRAGNQEMFQEPSLRPSLKEVCLKRFKHWEITKCIRSNAIQILNILSEHFQTQQKENTENV